MLCDLLRIEFFRFKYCKLFCQIKLKLWLSYQHFQLVKYIKRKSSSNCYNGAIIFRCLFFSLAVKIKKIVILETFASGTQKVTHMECVRSVSIKNRWWKFLFVARWWLWMAPKCSECLEWPRKGIRRSSPSSQNLTAKSRNQRHNGLKTSHQIVLMDELI